MKSEAQPALSFSKDDKVGTVQPHDDALVVTFCIRGYDARRILVDQGSGAQRLCILTYTRDLI